ncbi:uncharacterized protein LOC133303852 [Gastrolobium bilobum]|uniref:uncharacterized protein LOC133303852 n=1 Tax=Gastrolobium bilobum TaxID=150636 RepID=UPI002AB0A10A|nr:uncharacterized protein LOC133303852 [Gastrolobium bilobum]
MESLKLKYYKDFREQVRANFDDLVTLVQQLEPKVRLYYSEDIQLSREKLVELILMDSCFIFEFILTFTSTGDDCVPFKCWLESNIAHDLLLLENELPFDVLDKLYNLASPSPDFLLFADLTFHLFWIPYGDSPPSIKHFTYILRISYLSPTDSLSPRMDELNAYYERTWNNARASLRRDYCWSPWKVYKKESLSI